MFCLLELFVQGTSMWMNNLKSSKRTRPPPRFLWLVGEDMLSNSKAMNVAPVFLCVKRQNDYRLNSYLIVFVHSLKRCLFPVRFWFLESRSNWIYASPSQDIFRDITGFVLPESDWFTTSTSNFSVSTDFKKKHEVVYCNTYRVWWPESAQKSAQKSTQKNRLTQKSPQKSKLTQKSTQKSRFIFLSSQKSTQKINSK